MGAPELLRHLRGAGLVLTVTAAGDLYVAPRSALTDDHRAAIRASKAELLALLGADAKVRGKVTELRKCPACRHRNRFGACREPVAAGLAEHHGIRWAEPMHAARCPAFERKESALEHAASAQLPMPTPAGDGAAFDRLEGWAGMECGRTER